MGQKGGPPVVAVRCQGRCSRAERERAGAQPARERGSFPKRRLVRLPSGSCTKSIAHMAGDRRILLPARHGTGAEADSRPPRSPRSLVRSFAQPRSCVPGRAPRAARPRPLLRPTSTRARRTCRRLCAYASSGPGAVRVWAEGCVCRRGRIGGVSVC